MSAARLKVGRIKPKPKAEVIDLTQDRATKPAAQPRTPRTKPRPTSRMTTPSAPPLAIAAQKAAAAAAAAPNGGRTLPDPPSGSRGSPHTIAYTDTDDAAEEDEEDDDDDDLEEVAIPQAGPSSPFPETPRTEATAITGTPGTVGTPASLDEAYAGYGDESDEEGNEDEGVIRLEFGGETPEEKAKRIALAMRKKPLTSKDRAVRIEAHKLHVIALLANAKIRNRWCSNSLLKARLLSLVPHSLVSAFAIPPSRFPDRAQRSRLFFDALQSLATWWSQSFFDVPDNTIGLRTRPWDEVQEIVDKLPKLDRTDLMESSAKWAEKKAKDKSDSWSAELAAGSGGERLRTVNSLMKKALQQEGSRDVSGILFVSLCRACGLGTRLVVSLQPVPWRAEKVVAKKKSGAGKGGRSVASRQGNGTVSANDDDDDEDDFEEVPIPGDEEGGPIEVMGRMKARKNKDRAGGKRRLQDPADVYRLRKQKTAPVVAGQPPKPKTKPKLDLSQHPPVIWAEVFSRSDQRWIPVDPLRGTIRKKTHFEPASDNGPIRLTYVVAYEEDGYARDVTLRYTKSFGAKTAKLRPPKRPDEPDWWEVVLGFLTRPYRLNRDDLEDAELETSQVSEAMPMHLNGFKDHPIYVLERHLKREEVLHPRREVGKFRGESVYRRAHVQQCRTADNWMRVGRIVKHGQEPLKWVKQRAVTLEKRRQQELAKQDGEEILQGLYAQWQTELYRAPPIKDGIIPQNNFGNIDLYVPTMLPAGAVHLAYKGIAKVAKGLGISYAEACTGFEFKKRRAIPVITGIVVAAENETLVMEAYWESAAVQEEKERIKAEEKALKRWAKLINGLRVRRRLQQEYGGQDLEQTQYNPLADADAAKEKEKERRGRATMDVLRKAGDKGQKAWEDKVRDQTPEDVKPAIEPSDRQDVKPEIPQESESSDQSSSDNDMEEVAIPTKQEPSSSSTESSMDEVEAYAPPARARRPTRTTKPKPVPRRTGGRKRKASETLSGSSEDAAERPARQAKVPARLPAATAAGVTTRSLRSRAPKTDEQEASERAKRERLRQALAEEDEA